MVVVDEPSPVDVVAPLVLVQVLVPRSVLELAPLFLLQGDDMLLVVVWKSAPLVLTHYLWIWVDRRGWRDG